MRKQFQAKLTGDESRNDASAAFTLPFDTREVWGKAKVPVKVTINGYTWLSAVGNRGGIQCIMVNAEASRSAGVKAGDFVTIALEPDTERREIFCVSPVFQTKFRSVVVLCLSSVSGQKPPTSHIWRIDPDGSNPIQLSPGSGVTAPACSADGTKVFYQDSESNRIMQIPVEGGTPELVPGGAFF